MRELDTAEMRQMAGGQLLLTGWAPWPQLQAEREASQPQVAPNQMYAADRRHMYDFARHVDVPRPYLFGH